MVKFSVVDSGCGKKEISYFISEIRKASLIASTEKDADGDTIYHTHNFYAVKQMAEEYDGLMIDIYKDKY